MNLHATAFTTPSSHPPQAMPSPGPTRAAQVMNPLPQPLFVLQPDRRLLFANSCAEQLLTQGRARLREAHLMSLGQLDAPRLGELLQMARLGSSSHTGLWFAPELVTGWLHTSPLATSIAQASDWSEDCLLLSVHLDQPALTQPARIDALTRQCRLSQAERHVLMLLADGDTVEDVAERLGLCVSTVRSHVRNLLGKTQARSLMQLLRWTGSAGALPH